MKIDGMKFTVRIPYISQIDVPYKYSERYEHLRQYGSRYGDGYTDLTFNRFCLVRKDADGSQTEMEMVEIDGKVVPLATLKHLMDTLAMVNGPTYELISSEKAAEIRESVEKEVKAEKAAAEAS